MANHGTSHEFVIVGGSLAGIAAAIRLKQLGYDPLVLDKANFPRPKLCGEFLGPDAFSPLHKLGLYDQIREHAWQPVEKTVFYGMGKHQLEIDLKWMDPHQPYGWAISRHTLDSLLVQHARRLGVTVLESIRVLPEIQPCQNGFVLKLIQPGQCDPVLLNARYLIDASGRHGGLFLSGSKYSGSHGRSDHLGISVHVEKPTGIPDCKTLNMYFFPGGYGGLLPLSETRMNLCMLISKKLAKSVQLPYESLCQKTIAQNPYARELLEGTRAESGFETTANLNLNLVSLRSQDLIRVGDALITMDPFTGSGMAVALETGVLAAETFAKNTSRTYEDIRNSYYLAYGQRFGQKLRLLPWFRPILSSSAIHHWAMPLLKPFLPRLARTFR